MTGYNAVYISSHGGYVDTPLYDKEIDDQKRNNAQEDGGEEVTFNIFYRNKTDGNPMGAGQCALTRTSTRNRQRDRDFDDFYKNMSIIHDEQGIKNIKVMEPMECNGERVPDLLLTFRAEFSVGYALYKVGPVNDDQMLSEKGGFYCSTPKGEEYCKLAPSYTEYINSDNPNEIILKKKWPMKKGRSRSRQELKLGKILSLLYNDKRRRGENKIDIYISACLAIPSDLHMEFHENYTEWYNCNMASIEEEDADRRAALAILEDPIPEVIAQASSLSPASQASSLSPASQASSLSPASQASSLSPASSSSVRQADSIEEVRVQNRQRLDDRHPYISPAEARKQMGKFKNLLNTIHKNKKLPRLSLQDILTLLYLGNKSKLEQLWPNYELGHGETQIESDRKTNQRWRKLTKIHETAEKYGGPGEKLKIDRDFKYGFVRREKGDYGGKAGMLKRRFEDFIVSEKDNYGKEVLSPSSVPQTTLRLRRRRMRSRRRRGGGQRRSKSKSAVAKRRVRRYTVVRTQGKQTRSRVRSNQRSRRKKK